MFMDRPSEEKKTKPIVSCQNERNKVSVEKRKKPMEKIKTVNNIRLY